MMIKSTDIVFVSLPPALNSIASPAFSVLKPYLEAEGIPTSIIYANHLLEQHISYFKEASTTNTEALLPFLSLLSKGDPVRWKYIETYYKSLFPDLFLTDRSLARELIADVESEYIQVMDGIIDFIVESGAKIVGLTSKFGQWIPGVVLANRIKEKYPDMTIISGGWTSSTAALDFLKLNPDIDYSVWGEGKFHLWS